MKVETMEEPSDNTFTDEDQKTLDALEAEEKAEAGAGTDEAGKSSEENGGEKKVGEEGAAPAKDETLLLGKYKDADALEKAFLSNQGETTRLIQSHQSETATLNQRIADLEAAEKASPEPPEVEPEDIPDPMDDMEGYLTYREKQIVEKATRAAADSYDSRTKARDEKDAVTTAEAEERDRYAAQAMEYIEEFYPGKQPKDIPGLVDELTRELEYGAPEGITKVVTARKYREMLDPKRVEREAQKTRTAQLKDLKERRARFEAGGGQIISDEPLNLSDVAGKSYEQLGADFVKGLG